jgi:hypothetical protein
MQSLQSDELSMKNFIELGKLNLHIKRGGVFRRQGENTFVPFTFGISPKSLNEIGIHPDEVELMKRWDEIKKEIDLIPNSILVFSIDFDTSPIIAKLENLNALKLLRMKIMQYDLDYSILNINLLDDFHINQIPSDLSEFDLTHSANANTNRFPYSAGIWTAKSRKWGRQYPGEKISPYACISVSKNRAITELLQEINKAKQKLTGGVMTPLPFDPFMVSGI